MAQYLLAQFVRFLWGHERRIALGEERSSLTFGDVTVFTSDMHLSLDGCLAKLDRAYEHMRAIHDELVVFFQTHPYTVAGELDANTGWYIVRLIECPEPSERIGFLIGEFAHQLRSILDHLIAEIRRWYFAQERKGLPKARTVFISETSPKRFREKSQRIRDLPQHWQDLIERMQPYHAADNNPISQIDWLEEVWNADKHSSVYKIPSRVFLSLDRLRAAWTPNDDVASLGDRRIKREALLIPQAEIARIKLVPCGPDPQVDVNGTMKVTLQVDGKRLFDLSAVLKMAGFNVAMILATFPTGARAKNHPFITQSDLWIAMHWYEAAVLTAHD